MGYSEYCHLPGVEPKSVPVSFCVFVVILYGFSSVEAYFFNENSFAVMLYAKYSGCCLRCVYYAEIFRTVFILKEADYRRFCTIDVIDVGVASFAKCLISAVRLARKVTFF